MLKRFVLIVVVVVFGPECVAQDINAEKALDSLLKIEEHYVGVRRSCCAFISVDALTDDPKEKLPFLAKLECIYASNESGMRRYDVAMLGNNPFEIPNPDLWKWSRMLKQKGIVKMHLQGEKSGGSSKLEEEGGK